MLLTSVLQLGGSIGRGTSTPVSPNIQTIVPSAVADLDAFYGASYTSGQTWANLVTAPADGSAQTAYDFFLGTDGSAGANDPTFNTNEFTLDGGDWFTIAGGNTALLKNIHKTTGGNAFSIVMVGKFTAKPASGAGEGSDYFGNNARNNSNQGISGGNGTFFDYTNKGFLNIVGTAAETPGTELGNATSDGTYKFIAFTYDPSTRACKLYSGATSTPQTFSRSAYTATVDPIYDFQLMAGGNGHTPQRSGSALRAVSMYNAVLSNADVTALRAEYSTRHSASY